MQGESTDTMDGINKKKTVRQKQTVQASKHVLFTDTAVSATTSALCNVASADLAQVMQIISPYQVDTNRRPSKYSQLPHESTGGLARRAFTDKITVLCTSSCLHQSSTGR